MSVCCSGRWELMNFMKLDIRNPAFLLSSPFHRLMSVWKCFAHGPPTCSTAPDIWTLRMLISDKPHGERTVSSCHFPYSGTPVLWPGGRDPPLIKVCLLIILHHHQPHQPSRFTSKHIHVFDYYFWVVHSLPPLGTVSTP